MDNNALKTGVFYNENIFCDICEQPIDVDFTLPDYCADISKIFKCKTAAYITSKGINGKNITIDGNIHITLLYCDSQSKLCSYEYVYPFSKIKEMSEECDDSNITATIKCDYINCRAVTGRKVEIHGAASIKIRVFKRKSNQIVSDYDGDDVQLKRLVAPATVPMGYREKYLIIENEITIGNAQAPIDSVIRCDAAPCIAECKVINDKVIVKGELALTVLYNAQSVKIPQVIKSSLPFSQIVEIKGVTDLCKCDAVGEVSALEIKPFATLTGDCRSMMVNAKILLKCECYCVNDIAVIEDAFSTKYTTNITKNKLTFEKICENIRENCSCKKNVEFEKDINSIIDTWCDLQSKKVKFENGNMCLSAVLLVGMVVCDHEDNVSFCEKAIDFEWMHPISCECDNLYSDPEIEVTAVGFTILNSNCLELRMELLINGAIYEKTEVSLITDMQVDKNSPCSDDKKGGMVICFATNGECVWDIARRYNASIEEIMSINELEKESFDDRKMILIPRN